MFIVYIEPLLHLANVKTLKSRLKKKAVTKVSQSREGSRQRQGSGGQKSASRHISQQEDYITACTHERCSLSPATTSNLFVGKDK